MKPTCWKEFWRRETNILHQHNKGDLYYNNILVVSSEQLVMEGLSH